MSKICIVGDIIVDVSLKKVNNPLKMRLGGVIHAARALWAMNVPYSIGYFAPEYLDTHINKYISHFSCSKIIKLGNVKTCPYVMLIEEVKEVGDQGYEFLLRDNVKISYDETEIQKLDQFDDIFLISGNYDYNKVENYIPLNCKQHYDIANNNTDLSFFKKSNKLETIFLSTSSSIFKSFYIENSYTDVDFFSQFEKLTENIVLKENRGGSKAFNFKNKEIINIPSQTQKISHSVGVGDVYDIAYVALYRNHNSKEALNFSSWIATEYAKTTFSDDFKKMVSRVLKINASEIISLGGCFLPWEIRKKCHIYIAAPDFDEIDTRPIDFLESSLLFHNFKPHRPIQENGQMEENANFARKQELFNKDMALLDNCNMLIAVLLFNDPGTFIEIGIAAERKIPTLVYDPYNIAINCMLTQLPNLISSDLDEILSEVFCSYSKLFSKL